VVEIGGRRLQQFFADQLPVDAEDPAAQPDGMQTGGPNWNFDVQQ